MLRVMPNEYESAIFGGGGLCGLSYAGALKRLGDVPGFSYDNLKRAAGVSIGCLAALAICLGLKPDEMFTHLSAIDFSRILDIALPHRMLIIKAKYKGDYIFNELKKLLSTYTKRNDPHKITFNDLKNAGFKDLYIITTEFRTIGKEVQSFQKVHSFETTPNQCVIKSIMASIALPFLFRPIYFEGTLNLDGGITNNFPYQLFHAKKYLPINHPEYIANDATYINNPYTLGMAIMPFDPSLPNIPLENFYLCSIIKGIVNGLLKRSYDLTIEYESEKGTLILIHRKKSITDFNISKSEKEEVLLAGAHAVSKTFGLEDVRPDYCCLPEEVYNKSCWAKLFGPNTSLTKPPILSKRMSEHARIYRASF